ncbi:DUF1648 domain-containing protein [Streptomyces sp. NPDC012794]|uniref:DUF1648 domain-containing protein n=1 Tax=Streptomyces sp. NPDC012794 TaxID=3364850 RepID=UPI00369AEC2D
MKGPQDPQGPAGPEGAAGRPALGLWGAGVAAVLVALPWAASGRLPERLATHWSASSGAPDGSMPLWAAALLPAVVWAALVLLTAGAARWCGRAAASAVLPAGGVFLVGGQACVVRANLDRADWHQARLDSLGIALTLAVAVAVAVAVAAGLAGRLMTRRRSRARPPAALRGPGMEIPAGETFVWFSRTANPWLRATAAVTGLAAVAAALAAVAGLVPSPWALVTPLAVTSVVVVGCSSVRASVTERGLEVALGPFGMPVRRWRAGDIESARAEHRTAAQVGGWGYRLSGRGTTVMLRAGECLVVRPLRGGEFAVSVGDAERGAALLNSLVARRTP